MDPLEWNNLDEAASWLSGTTGEAWGAKHVLSAALKYPKSSHRYTTYLKAAMPRDTHFGLYRWDIENGGQRERVMAMMWQTIPLPLVNISDLLVHGETRVSIARRPDDDFGIENEYVFIEPLDQEHVVTVGMAGINRHDLLELTAKIKAYQETPLLEGRQTKPLPTGCKVKDNPQWWNMAPYDILDMAQSIAAVAAAAGESTAWDRIHPKITARINQCENDTNGQGRKAPAEAIRKHVTGWKYTPD